MKKNIVVALGLLIIGVSLMGCNKEESMKEAAEDDIVKGGFSVAASCHDPEIVVGEDGYYYMFGSHMVGAKSSDLRKWEYFANGVDSSNPMFDNLLGGDYDAFSYVGKNTDNGYSVWASNVYYNETMNKYTMYFCTTSSYIKSSICMATADEVEGPYTYQGKLLDSGYGKNDVNSTNLYDVLGKDADIDRYLEYGGYNNKIWPNCIDPSIFQDEEKRLWMVYGSWSGGIYLLEIDPSTGYPIHPKMDETNNVDTYYGKKLVGGGHHSIEGPYIEYSEETGYYYLFLSYGELKTDGGYQIRVFRSENPMGPYVDTEGNTLDDSEDYWNYGLKLMGNYSLPSLSYTYMAPGGQSTFKDKDERYYITYHQRFDNNGEYFEPRVHQMFLSKDGWFVIAPFATNGESLSKEGYETSSLEGTFYILNHGIEISSKVEEPVLCQLDGNGNVISEDIQGTYKVDEDSNNITLVLNGVEYQGVILEMKDEADNQTLCFTVKGDNNQSIWGVQYLKN